MKILTMVLSVISILLMLSTLTCGLWLKAKGADPEGIAFHIKLAIPTVVVTLATFALLITSVLKQ